MNGPYPVPQNTAPYFERSFGATQYLPNESFRPAQPFGPILMFESNIDNGLGYNSAYHRLNARIPYHIVPNTTVMIGDLSGSVTNDGDPVYNYGLVYRNYDAALNRIFGWNVFGDYEHGQQTGEFYRMSVGLESLGKYIDWRGNGYFILGDDSYMLNNTLTGDYMLAETTFSVFVSRPGRMHTLAVISKSGSSPDPRPLRPRHVRRRLRARQ